MSVNLLMLLADGVEECEALVTRDVLLRGGINVTMKSIMGREVVISQDNLLVKCDTEEVDLEGSYPVVEEALKTSINMRK